MVELLQSLSTAPALRTFGHFSANFSNFDVCRSEEAGDVIPGVVLRYVGGDVLANLVIAG